ncbi:MAG: endolytic transglycosylase MltG [Candidatus Tenebribacter burtonii]|nr:endolytic transglycosylase MltG [Candidatus Tenebribacter burtonii]
MKLARKVIIVLVILTILLVLYITSLVILPKKVNEILIDISKGESAQAIAEKLYEKNVIHSKRVFYLYVKFTNLDKTLSFGKYHFSGKLSLLDVVKIIKFGKVVLRKVTIPEGLTVKKTAKVLSQYGFVDQNKFIVLCNDSLFAMKLTGFSVPSLEGFLYPETYHFPYEVSEQYIIKTLVQEFFSQTQSFDFVPNRDLDFYETLVLASIVEREARYRDEQPTIASVYLNRIKYNYKLQADPTVAYALELEGKIRKKIYYRDLKIDSPFNTYKNYGLPPTPICSPAISAIQAVLEPTETDFFFFFANGSGRHEFNQTYQQHINQQNTINK